MAKINEQNYTAILEAERSVIGCLLLDSSYLSKIDVSPNDFTHRDTQMIYAAIVQMVGLSKPIDAITVAEHLEGQSSDPWLSVTGMYAKNAIASRNIVAYADVIRRESKKRIAKSIAKKLDIAIDDDMSAIDDAIRELMALDHSSKDYNCTLIDAVNSGINEIEKAMEAGGVIGISTGIDMLDNLLSGLRDTDLYIVGATPAMGKTAFMLNMIDAANVRCGFISGEQAREQIGLRMISINGKVDSSKLRTANLDDSDWPKVTRTIQNFTNKNPIFINDDPSPHIDEVIRVARKWKHAHDIKVLYVDYLQRIRGNGERKFEQVDVVVTSLKTLARELKIPIVALSQINRDVSKRNNRRPFMTDLSDSSSIEKEADVIMTIYRDEYYNPETPDKGIAEISILKNRHGPTSMIKTLWREDILRFENIQEY